jgi:lipoprotein-anchoring transpeptidase ErfK/SrfK
MKNQREGNSRHRRNRVRNVLKMGIILILLAIGAGASIFFNRKKQTIPPPRSNSSVAAASSIKSVEPATSSGADQPTATTSDWMNIRSDVGTDTEIVCSVPGNTRLKLTGKANADGTWVQVKTSSGKVGWCCRALLDVETVDAVTVQAPVGMNAPLSIKVSLANQKVYVVDAGGVTVKTFTCSSGGSGNETPKGRFSVGGRGKSFYSPSVKEGGYYWTRFYGDFLFHSIPFDKYYKIETAEAARLGKAVSHGCVRLALTDAKWIYEHIQDGTKVVIQ